MGKRRVTKVQNKNTRRSKDGSMSSVHTLWLGASAVLFAVLAFGSSNSAIRQSWAASVTAGSGMSTVNGGKLSGGTSAAKEIAVYVSNNGDDEKGDGSYDHPFRTLTKAFQPTDTSSKRYTVYIKESAGHTYLIPNGSEQLCKSLPEGSANRQFTLTSVEPGKVSVNAANPGNGVILISCPNISIQGLQFLKDAQSLFRDGSATGTLKIVNNTFVVTGANTAPIYIDFSGVALPRISQNFIQSNIFSFSSSAAKGSGRAMHLSGDVAGKGKFTVTGNTFNFPALTDSTPVDVRQVGLEVNAHNSGGEHKGVFLVTSNIFVTNNSKGTLFDPRQMAVDVTDKPASMTFQKNNLLGFEGVAGWPK